MYSSQDAKIMKFDPNKSWNEFVSLFNDAEFEQMKWHLEHNCSYDSTIFDDFCEGEVKERILSDYICEWLIENIYELRTEDTAQLFRLRYM